jgi:chemotaxis protein methyltransferase CheR
MSLAIAQGIGMNPPGKTDCAALLRWALPRLGLAWPGFRRVHRQVCKRIHSRLWVLGLPDFSAYRVYLEGHPAEWPILDSSCRIPISRFYRDAEVFTALGETVLPRLAAEALAGGLGEVRCWSAGCASGEEPYSLAILWNFRLAARFAPASFHVLATDADPHLLERAAQACYRRDSLRELPREWIDGAFERRGELYCLKTPLREAVSFRRHDIREAPPGGPFDLILCRNLAFTYFDAEYQQAALHGLLEVLRPGGGLVIGRKEALPADAANVVPWLPGLGIYRREGG